MKRILVAEDDRTTRTMLESVLTAAGYAVVCVADGAAALKKIREGNFDLVLTDIWMPKINGLELMGRLHAEGVRPKVVVMTSILPNTPQCSCVPRPVLPMNPVA